MSAVYTQQGTIAATAIVSVEPDRSGNFWCDGTDDDVEVAAAVAYVIAMGGGVVHVRIGTYTMTASVNVPDEVSIFGEGDATIFAKAFDGTQVFEITTTGTTEGQILRDFMIDGDSDNFTGIGIFVNGVSRNLLIENLRIYKCSVYGIHINDSWSSAVKDCLIHYCGTGGIFKDGTGNAILIDNCVIRFNLGHGILFNGGNRHRVINCTIEKSSEAFKYGIRINSGNYITILNNSFEDFAANSACIFVIGNIARVLETTIAYNYITEDNVGIHIDTATDTQIFNNNILGAGTGINITANAINTWVFFNTNNATTRITDAGINTILPTIQGDFPVSNVGGGATAVVPVINTSPGGVDIDANDEFTHVKIPLGSDIQQVVRIKIWAYSNVIEATNNMLLRIVAHGAGSSELWSGNAIDVVNHPSVEEGSIVQYDVLHWVIDAGDDAQIGTLAAQDFVELLAVGEPTDGTDIGTDAYFGGYEIQYV